MFQATFEFSFLILLQCGQCGLYAIEFCTFKDFLWGLAWSLVFINYLCVFRTLIVRHSFFYILISRLLILLFTYPIFSVSYLFCLFPFNYSNILSNFPLQKNMYLRLCCLLHRVKITISSRWIVFNPLSLKLKCASKSFLSLVAITTSLSFC